MLTLSHVKKSFGHNQVLKDVSLDVNKGDVVVIIGPSGSGKTTLLRCINFLEHADAGTMTFDGRAIDMHATSKREQGYVRKRVGFVFQNYALFVNKTALQNITEGLVVSKKITKKQAEEKALAVLEWTGMLDKKDAYPSQLSGGQQQRIGIARAIALDPEVILFDEPTSALDPELVGGVLALIKRVAETGVTMIIVTHEMAFAREIATHVVFMDGGIIVEEGSAEEIFVNTKNERTRQFLECIR